MGGDLHSDHAPFWERGVPALHLASFPQPPTYHTMGDTMDNVDPTFTLAVVDLLEPWLVELAGEFNEPPPPVAPRSGGCGGG